MLQYSIIFVPKFLQKYTIDHNIIHFIMGISWVFIQSINYRGQEIKCMGGSRISGGGGHMYKGEGGSSEPPLDPPLQCLCGQHGPISVRMSPKFLFTCPCPRVLG